METQDGVEVFESDIDTYLHLFCEENGIEDLKKESQSVWNSCLYYIYKHVFKNTNILKDNTLMNIPNNNIKSSCNRYNIDMCMKVLDIYSNYKEDLKEKDPKYKKIACINYVIFAIFLVLNFLMVLLLKIDVPILSMIIIIYYAISKYFFNFAFCVISLINSILQAKINSSIYTLFSFISTIIMIVFAILFAVLL